MEAGLLRQNTCLEVSSVEPDTLAPAQGLGS